MMKKRLLLLFLTLILSLSLALTGCEFLEGLLQTDPTVPPTPDNPPVTSVPENLTIGGEKIPAYSTEPYYVVNGNKPFFTKSEITDEGFYTYTDLDALGRAGAAFASIGPETLPDDEREDIGHIEPSGWRYNGKSNNNRYDKETVAGGYIYNRAHLLANQLVSEDVDERNLITGTSSMNQKQMVPFENQVANYVKEDGGHVMYRVTPYFEGQNLVCAGVLMEAYSVEDEGESVEFCVFIYNVQPGIYINYLTGENCLLSELGDSTGSTPTPEPHVHSVGAEGDRAASCTSMAYCSVCKKEYGPILPHTPCADDGDCTTPITCSVCNTVTTAAASHTGGTATCMAKAKCETCGKEYGDLLAHTPGTDDGDCTTAVTCSVCNTVTTPAKSSHTGGTATCNTLAKCGVCGKDYGSYAPHLPNADDGDCTTAVTCSVCNTVTTPAKSSHTGGTATCEALAKCGVCGKDYGNYAPHLPNADDGDPTTDITCSVCGAVTTPGVSSSDPNLQVPQNLTVNGIKIPSYTSSPYFVLNNNIPFFTQNEITTNSFYTYSELDALGRAGAAFGCISKETMPTDAREDIDHIHPSGWYYNGKSNNNSYSIVPDGWIFNRSHLFANMLVSEDVDVRNFVTGTQSFNQTHMLSFENKVKNYIDEENGHVMYRVTPYFEGQNLICAGVLMEGWSIEDNGESVSFCVFIYNVQPGIYINYLTGENKLADTGSDGDTGITYTKVDAPTVGVAYKLTGTYTSGGDRFATGIVASQGISHTDDITKSLDIYLENAGSAGAYYMYYYQGTTKYYIVMNGTGTKNFKASTTKDSYWTINSNGALVSSYNGRALGVNNNSGSYFRAYLENDVNRGTYPALYFVKID